MAIVTKEFLEKEYYLSPIPVLECGKSDRLELQALDGFAFVGGNGGAGEYLGGLYFDNTDPKLIIVDESIPEYKRLAVFYHELTHVECLMSGCPCFNDDYKKIGLCEHHAQMGTIIKCMQRDFIDSLDFVIGFTKKLLLQNKNSEAYMGAFLTINSPFWEANVN